MAFELEDFSRTGSLGKGGSLWMYTTDDTDASVISAGYFNSAYSSLRTGDIITCSTASNLIFVEVLTIASRVVSVDLATSEAASNRVIISSAEDWPEVIDGSKQYFIDGHVDMGTRSIEIPQGGLHLAGLDLELSKLYSTADAYTMFTSPIGGSGNILGKDYTIDVSGEDSQVFNIVAWSGFEAFEFSQINYENCTSLGTIDNYRQGLEVGSGRFGGTPSLTLKGTWAGGYRITTSIVRVLSSSMMNPLFKAGAGFNMASRFLTDINVDLPPSAALLDFSPSNFPNPSTLQIQNAIVTRGGIRNANDSNITPNVSKSDLCSDWVGNNGLPNTFVGASAVNIADTITTITAQNVEEVLQGSFATYGLEHFDEPTDGELRHVGVNPREFRVSWDMVIEGRANDNYEIRLIKKDVLMVETLQFSQVRTMNNLQGGRDVGYWNGTTNIILNQNESCFWKIVNLLDNSNCTLEDGSQWTVEER